MSIALAVDMGGTKVEAALVDGQGRLHEGSRARRHTGPEADATALREALREVITAALGALGHESLHGIGIGSAGPIQQPGGTITPFNMPQATGFPLRETVSSLVAEVLGHSVPAVLALDGGCIALAESWLGATASAACSFTLVVSTGIGGGFVAGGRYIAGAGGNAGHIGQLRIDGGELLERAASGPASVAWARAQGWDGQSGEELARSAADGDATARAAIERSARLVGFGLAEVATLVDLDIIAIGGGFSFVSDDYVELVQRALRERAVHDYSRATRVLRAALGVNAPLIGAAALVLR